MAKTNATRLADFGSGIGTQGAIIQVDNTNKRVGIGTSNPNATLTVGAVGASGTSLFVHGDARITGVLTATGGFSGTALLAQGLTGRPDVTVVNVVGSGASFSGIVTAGSYQGDGSALTGISGFGTQQNATVNTLGNLLYTTPKSKTLSAGSSFTIESNQTAGMVVYTRLNEITVGNGSTLHIGSGTTVAMDVLDIFTPGARS